MFHVLTITYLQPPEVVAEARAAHVDWVKAHVEAGNLILAGRLGSGTGGILITADISAEAADEMTSTDPYELAGLVRYDRTSFEATLRAPGL
ncbi:YciI family protein [Mycolicibacterium sp.]|uniref:YciI family protein n=1 Tax=Mycolicibacterium sp. TaxID=2320850 RepID=UPI001A244517|nr:YciI family protein [Mycolicibacterium sp.]MBJ7336216.1 GTP cyclohydrolase [Mycolicibacterium sp.]